MKQYVVTISRQFGSMGRMIAQQLSRELGVNFYDRDIVEETASRMGLPVSVISNTEENSKSIYFKQQYPLGMGIASITHAFFRVLTVIQYSVGQAVEPAAVSSIGLLDRLLIPFPEQSDDLCVFHTEPLLSFLLLTLIVRIQCEKVTPIITFFQKKERACFPWCGKQAQLEISCHAKECNRTSEWWASHWHPVPSPCGTSEIPPD